MRNELNICIDKYIGRGIIRIDTNSRRYTMDTATQAAQRVLQALSDPQTPAAALREAVQLAWAAGMEAAYDREQDQQEQAHADSLDAQEGEAEIRDMEQDGTPDHGTFILEA